MFSSTVIVGSVIATMFDLFCGAGAMLNDLIKLVEAVGALEPRVVALMVIALGLVVVAYIVTR